MPLRHAGGEGGGEMQALLLGLAKSIYYPHLSDTNLSCFKNSVVWTSLVYVPCFACNYAG